MDLSKRLQTIVDYVPKGTNTVVDIGTDHGYIPIYLIKHQLAHKCIACDINPMPLANAQKNIRRYNMEDQIETRLSNGLSKVQKGEADAIIIAGMGGMLIIDILKENQDLVKAVGLLILQPQLDADQLRRYIHSIEYTIASDEMIYDDGRYYTVISARPGKETPYSDQAYMFGKKILEKKDKVFKESLQIKINDLNKLKNHLSKVGTTETANRIIEINKELALHEEVLTCL